MLKPLRATAAVDTPARPRPAAGYVPAGDGDPGARPGDGGPGARRPRHWGWAVGGVVLLALLLRLWGITHGLPFAYNADENAHFATRAIGIFGHDWNPEYFVNPPAYTYLVHLVFAVWFGGRDGVSEAFATDPGDVWLVARVVAAVLGSLAVWLLYLAGARLFDRRAGLLAAGMFAVAFLPVFYAHLALNDVATLAPLCLSLWGTIGILRRGRTRDYVIAGVGLGLACATKYTAGIVLIPLLVAAVVQWRDAGADARRQAMRGLGVALGGAFVIFLLANPYAVLDFEEFWNGLRHQSDASGDAAGKLGLTQENGVLYYLWSFGWGLGWIPLLAAVAAVPLLWRDERRLVWFLAPAPIFFVLFMGSQERYFGRWLMPVFPIVCLLASYLAFRLLDRLSARRTRLRPTLVALAVVALCVQGFVYSVHIGLVLSREDTRNMARDWMVSNVPVGAKIVVEPVVPDQWAQDIGDPSPVTSNGNRWIKYGTSRSRIEPRTGRLLPPPGIVVNIEDYERTLRPELVGLYERQGFCWVVVGSTQRGRAEAQPEQAPGAIAYYRTLERRADVAYRASPYGRGEGPVEFNFDWTFDFYPLAYHRPGPEMTVYRLRGGQCREP